jgi:2,3,4,5-tetrahydropyridine-2-carboxylate N-succinyltransferase
MNTYPLIAIGVTSLNSKKQQLDVRYLLIVNKDSQILNPLNIDNPGYDELQTLVENEKDIEGYKNALKNSLDLKENQEVVLHQMEEDRSISCINDAYLKLFLLSLRYCKPNEQNLEGIFDALPNVAWTNIGPVDPTEIESFRAKKVDVTVRSVDKFPCMLDYVVPSGVRIADGSRVRLGAYLSEGTTIMHEGFVNFNAGTLGPTMIEGRISAGVIVGKNSDLGGGCSTMGTLSGGNDVKISVGEDCLLGANSGLGIPIGDRCIVEAGLYLTAGTKVEMVNSDGKVFDTVKASELSGKNDLLFIRNSLSGAVQCIPNTKNVELNETLHKNV